MIIIVNKSDLYAPCRRKKIKDVVLHDIRHSSAIYEVADMVIFQGENNSKILKTR